MLIVAPRSRSDDAAPQSCSRRSLGDAVASLVAPQVARALAPKRCGSSRAGSAPYFASNFAHFFSPHHPSSVLLSQEALLQ